MPKGDKFELISLHGRGRAECLRMMLIIAGHPFIDMRFNLRQWHDFKRREKLSEDTKLPLLRVNDKKLIVGASEIGRFLALNLGFYGTSSIEQAEIEEIISEIESLQSGLTPIIRTTLAKNFSQRTGYWNEYKEKTLNPVLEQLTQKLDNKNYFLGNRLTWADIAVAENLSRFATCFDSLFLGSHPILKQHMMSIERMPALKNYILERPNSLF